MWFCLFLFAFVQLITAKLNITLIETKWPQSCPGERREHVCLGDKNHCSGLAREGFCEFPQFCCFQGTDASCKAKGACCQRKEYCTLQNVLENEPNKSHTGIFTFYAGLCPPSEALQCCKEGGPGGEICYGQTDDSKCIKNNAICNGAFIHDGNLCPNKHTSCCLPDPRGLAGYCRNAGGECTSTDHCASVHGSKSIPGICPGSNIITCCIYPKPIPKPLPPIIVIQPITTTPPPQTPSPTSREIYDDDLDDCMGCQELFDQVHVKQRYVSRQWYYTTLAQWCGVGESYGLRGLPSRTDVAFNLYPTCTRLFGNESPLIDEVITQLLDGWSSAKICHHSQLCVISSLDLDRKYSKFVKLPSRWKRKP